MKGFSTKKVLRTLVNPNDGNMKKSCDFNFKSILKTILPTPIRKILRLRYRITRNWKDLIACLSLLADRKLPASIYQRLGIIKQLYVVSSNVDSAHTQEEILEFIKAILSLPKHLHGVIVEAGCYKGSSTAKFSLAVKLVEKELVVFDSFQGIPENHELHDKSIFGGLVGFKRGAYCGTLDEVKNNVTRYGKIQCCRFIPGWFEETLPQFKEPVSAVYIDVDLASSTRTCLKYLYPLLETGGVLYSQDGHLPLVLEVFNDDNFWLQEVRMKKPDIIGLGKKKLIKIVK